jgi:hypothetical protein
MSLSISYCTKIHISDLYLITLDYNILMGFVGDPVSGVVIAYHANFSSFITRVSCLAYFMPQD